MQIRKYSNPLIIIGNASLAGNIN